MHRRGLMVALMGAWLSGCVHHEITVRATTAPVTGRRLVTRAQAFARYISAMHRQIHQAYTLGFLADIDTRKDASYADQTLWTQLAIAVDADGRLDGVAVARKSGLQAFDVAVVERVTATAPFPPPPDAIKSADGKVHLDWQFHRDERSCGTFGVDPHVYGPAGNELGLAETVEDRD